MTTETELRARIVELEAENLGLVADMERVSGECAKAVIFEPLADNSPDAIVIGDAEGKIIYANRALYELVGWDQAHDPIGTPVHTLWTEEQKLAIIQEAIPQAMAGGWSGQVQIRRSDGSLVDTYQSIFPLPDVDGNLVNGAIFIRDSSTPRQAPAELEASAQRLALLVEQTPLAVIECDLDLRITRWNQAAERIFGYTREETLGQHPAEFIMLESAREHVDHAWKTMIEENKVAVSTNENNTKSGAVIVCEWTNAPLLDAKGEIIGIVSIAQDVTERKKAGKEFGEQQALFGQVVDRFPGFVFVKDREGRFTLVNRTLAEHYQTTVQEMIGKTDIDFNPHLEEVEQFRRDDLKVMEALQDRFII